jgi:lysozyme family protein
MRWQREITNVPQRRCTMAQFEKAIGSVIANEGGYVNDPADAGGETNFGISKRAYPKLAIKELTQAEAERLYRKDYWSRYPSLEKIENQEVATKTLDLMVNVGPARAVRILQQSINEVADNVRPVVVDGKLGPATAKRANELDADDLIAAMQGNAARYYCAIVSKKPDQKKFLRGWLLRAYDRPRARTEPTPACSE